jgi:hypothetical protein
LTSSNKTVVPTHSTFRFLQLEMKLRNHHLDTAEVMEAEWQAVLNSLTEHDFQGAFMRCHKRWERCIRVEGDYSGSVGGL